MGQYSVTSLFCSSVVPQNKLKVNVSLDQENKVLCYYLDGVSCCVIGFTRPAVAGTGTILLVSQGKTSIEVHDLPNPRTKSYSCKGYNVTVQVSAMLYVNDLVVLMCICLLCV